MSFRIQEYVKLKTQEYFAHMILEYMSARLSEKMYMSDRMPEEMFHRLPEYARQDARIYVRWMLKYMSGRMPENMPDSLSKVCEIEW